MLAFFLQKRLFLSKYKYKKYCEQKLFFYWPFVDPLPIFGKNIIFIEKIMKKTKILEMFSLQWLVFINFHFLARIYQKIFVQIL